MTRSSVPAGPAYAQSAAWWLHAYPRRWWLGASPGDVGRFRPYVELEPR